MKYLSSERILLLILLLGLFFRIYKLEIFFPFGHDQDLFAWIAKDIIIDGHVRLIGQETSIIGVFIGPLFYYLIAFAFALFKMNPLSAAVVTTVVSMATIISIYRVFSKFFGKKVGLIGSFLYAVSPGAVFLDRWVVPTQPTILWAVWYLYVLLSTIKGSLPLILLSILVGLIWHIHIAFIPLLILLPFAYLLSDKNKPKFRLKTTVISFLIVGIFLAPFFLFEIRHGFGQINSLINAVYNDHDNLRGTGRLIKVFDSGGRSLAGAFVLSGPAVLLNSSLVSLLPFLLLVAIFYLWYFKALTGRQTVILLAWYFLVIIGQFFSKRIITEYYFNNLFIILFLMLALILVRIDGFFKKFPFVNSLLAVYLIVVTVWLIQKPDDLGGFLYKEKVIEYIKKHSENKNYPCVAVNFIESQPGGGNGFRYLFWYDKLSVITAGDDIPVYNIVNPWTISKDEVDVRFGVLGVIVPGVDKFDKDICFKKERQLLPLWGFNN